MYLASADAVLRDYYDNVINRTQVPLLFDITGKGKRPANPKKAQRRAVRGVSAQQQSKDCTAHINNLLASDIYACNVAPGITSVVPRPAKQSRQSSDQVIHLFSPPISGNGGQQPASVDTTAEFPLVADPFFWDLASIPVNAPPLIMTSASQHALPPPELGFNPHDMSKVFL